MTTKIKQCFLGEVISQRRRHYAGGAEALENLECKLHIKELGVENQTEWLGSLSGVDAEKKIKHGDIIAFNANFRVKKDYDGRLQQEIVMSNIVKLKREWC